MLVFLVFSDSPALAGIWPKLPENNIFHPFNNYQGSEATSAKFLSNPFPGWTIFLSKLKLLFTFLS
jgi:hypothetical protein